MPIRFALLSTSFIATLCTTSAVLAWPHNLQTNAPTLSIHVSETIEEGALNFIKELAQEGIGLLSKDNLDTEKRRQKFRELLQEKFDMKTIGRFALGRYWRTSTEEQKKEYLILFEDMIVEIYSRRFSDYNGEELKVLSARKEGKADVMVSSVIIPESDPKIAVDWRVRKKKNDQYKVVDIVVEGVSMSLTQRSDFASVIQRGGGNIDVLLSHLRKEK